MSSQLHPDLGISVISSVQDEYGLSFGVTAIVRLKHASLYEAVQKMGSAASLSRHLGISQQELGRWVNLKSVPPLIDESRTSGRFSYDNMVILEAKLRALTGKSWDELWPDTLRRNSDFLSSAKVYERRMELSEQAMLDYASHTAERFRIEQGMSQDDELEEMREMVNNNLHRLTQRQRTVLAYRFGIGREELSLSEIAEKLKITGERVRQIESNAIRILREMCAWNRTNENAS